MKPLTMTVERERKLRHNARQHLMLGTDDTKTILAEVDALRAALADERRHADALAKFAQVIDSTGETHCADATFVAEACRRAREVVTAHDARRAAEKSQPDGCSKEADRG